MSNPILYRLDAVSVLDVTGDDRSTIVNNVTTNVVKELNVGEGRETFVTDVRGKTLGHGFLYCMQDRLRFIGAAGQAQRIAEHLDRYTIREDAVPSVRDDDFAALIVPRTALIELGIDLRSVSSEHPEFEPFKVDGLEPADGEMLSFSMPILGKGTSVLLANPDSIQRACGLAKEKGISAESESEFHHARTISGFPWYGIDINDTNLPQEIDRDAVAISFTKGCYLGQETVARLDALGQVQRKLVRWSITGSVPKSGAKLQSDGKTVGRLTSIAATQGKSQEGTTQAGGTGGSPATIALGFARRSHFEPGAVAQGVCEASGGAFTGTVAG